MKFDMKICLVFIAMFSLILMCRGQIVFSYSSGTHIWVPPTNIDSLTVECWGGGGGAGNSANAQINGGHGGGGGAYARSIFTGLSGDSCFFSVGAAGQRGGTYSTGVSFTGTSGGDSWFSTQNSMPITSNFGVKAAGGGVGLNSYITQVSNGGSQVNSIGQIVFSGGNGKAANSNGGGGGGASASEIGPGMSATGEAGAIAAGTGGSGGSGASIGGTNGQIGIFPGGGGGGSDDWWQSASGNGANGKIQITLNGMYSMGLIYNDVNQNCIKDNGEIGLPHVMVSLVGHNYFATTDNNGNYFLPALPPGSYDLYIPAPTSWQNSCGSTITFNIVNSDSILTINPLGIFSLNPCAVPDVTIYSSLNQYFTNEIHVAACNSNSATGQLLGSYVDVQLDDQIIILNATLPYVALGNNIYRFETGDLNAGNCKNFIIYSQLSNPILGQTICMSANIYPVDICVLDTIPSTPIGDGNSSQTGGALDGLPVPCTSSWDHSSLTVNGWCQNDSVYFYVENHGTGDMTCYAPVLITINGVVTYTDSILLASGQGITFSYLSNGETWILNAEQHPLHPGCSHPNAHVEGCGGSSFPSPGSGCVNDFRLDDSDPVVDIYCGVVTGSHDPNDKTGYPNGYTEQHYINPNQQLQYVIRFQNTGNDTAFTVVIRDTLAYDLNIFTVTPGVASHPYEFRMYGPRVLEWTFNNILLPDSTTNLEGSNGFVTYHVEQVPDLAPGTVIHNKADIYFDLNEPVTTNETWHTIYNGFFAVAGVDEMNIQGTLFKVYPNPVNGQLTIEAGKNTNERFIVYDQMGKKIQSGKLSFPLTHIDMTTLNQGIYFIQVGDNESITFKTVKL
jgi:uncharacterized repeat protein (TIGR01451 family)